MVAFIKKFSFLQPMFRPRLPSKFVKRANMTQTFFPKCNIGIKNAYFDADFEFVEMVAKKLMRKNKKVSEKLSFLLLLLWAKVSGQ
jgi:hypothetical protein